MSELNLRLIPYKDAVAYAAFRDGKHIGDTPAFVGAAKRTYSEEEMRAGVSYPGADPGPEHCTPPAVPSEVPA